MEAEQSMGTDYGADAGGAEQPQPKRARLDECESNDFTVELPSSTALKTAVEIMSHTLIDVTFKVERPRAGSGELSLRVDAMDSGSVCACKVRIKCHGHVSSDCGDGGDKFCIKLKPMLEILRALPGNEGALLYRKKGGSDIELKTMGCESHHYVIHTLEDVYSRDLLEDCVTNYNVDFDLSRLKVHLRTIQSLRADCVRIQIYSLDTKTILSLLCEGQDAIARWNYVTGGPAEDSDAGGMGFLPADVDLSDGKKLYDEAFSAEYLTNFTRCMNRSSVTLSLNEGGEEDAKVLVLEYSLGLENSNVIFLLAAKATVD